MLLAFFAVALGNLSMWRLNEVLPQPALRALLTLAVWGGYFALFIRLPALSKRRNDLLNACGAVWLVAMMLLYRRLGVPVSVERSDIIILVLANVVVAGSFVWWATRRRPLARLGVVALLVALKIGASVPGSWNETLWNASFAPVALPCRVHEIPLHRPAGQHRRRSGRPLAGAAAGGGRTSGRTPSARTSRRGSSCWPCRSICGAFSRGI